MLLAGGAVCGVADDAGHHGSAGLWEKWEGGVLFSCGRHDGLMESGPEVLRGHGLAGAGLER